MTSNITPGAVPATPLGSAVSQVEKTSLGTVMADSTNPAIPAIKDTADPKPEKQKCPPVRQRGQMVPGYGYRMENSDWLADLTDPDPRRPGMHIGRDPLTIPNLTLIMAGHPARGTRAVVQAKRAAMGDADGWYAEVIEYSHIPEGICIPCAGSAHEVRQCAIINCPAWAFRTGRNPHSARRGKTPPSFAAMVKARDTREPADGKALREAERRLMALADDITGMSDAEKALLDGEAL